MPKTSSDKLYILVKSLKKAEKRYFKLFVGREGDASGMNMTRLFDLIDRQKEYDEAVLRTEMSLNKAQFANTKSHLYKRVLQSLRLYNTSIYEDLNIREMIDYVEILYNRSLYFQCQSILKKARKLAHKSDNLELLLEVLKWEKRILGQTVGRGNEERVNRIVEEVETINQRIHKINAFTNLAAQLNALYLRSGFIKDDADLREVQGLLKEGLPEYREELLSFPEKVNLYDVMVTYYYYLQDFRQVYDYARKWVDLYENEPSYIQNQLEMYIKGLNILLIAQNRLLLYNQFENSKRKLRNLRKLAVVKNNNNLNQRLLKYVYVHEFNGFFMHGAFDQGVKLIEKIRPGLEAFIDNLDNHSRIILYYKLACLYFGNNDFREAIRWLNIIINSSDYDLREDVLCFARILNLISHYELGNLDVIDYYLRSTYRFLYKKDDLHLYQKYILRFLRNLDRQITEEALVERFRSLRGQLIRLVDRKFESRAFIYFDIISWLDAKIEQKPVMEVIKIKAIRQARRQAA